ncbi:MAG: VOC family protein [Candidatus Dormibacteraeota bacterium]|uniref:VOC family protein n=1 Tax=Candidatus Amunia macphersoniae TaxID=3127014 RepID=A0A934KN67_9BACT|nr:VOC family protein [Candidatus Dormibacteraeota bacterium]
MDWKLELVTVPVSDIDRAKAFYTERVGFDVLTDNQVPGFRVVQLTPPGSACSIFLGKGIAEAPAGSAQGLHLVVSDIERARAELIRGGVDAGEIVHFEATGQASGPDPERRDYNSFVFFSDPDGNGWAVQEVGRRTPT